MFGASGGRWFGSARRTCFDSCSVGPAVLAVGTGGNGRADPSASLTCWANATVVALPAMTAAPIPAPTPLMIFTSRRLVIPPSLGSLADFLIFFISLPRLTGTAVRRSF